MTQPTRESMPDVPWREMISMRNRIVHGYDTIDLAIVWAVIEKDLPELVGILKRYTIGT